MSCLIVFKSITYAQNAQGLFGRNGILSDMVRPPLQLGKGSCSYGVKMNKTDLYRACQLMLQTHTKVAGMYVITPRGEYEEVTL